LSECRLLADFVAEVRCRLQRPHCALPRPVSARAIYRIPENRRNDVNACAYRKPSARAIEVVHVVQQHVAQMGEGAPLLRAVYLVNRNKSKSLRISASQHIDLLPLAPDSPPQAPPATATGRGQSKRSVDTDLASGTSIAKGIAEIPTGRLLRRIGASR
jgi:hypothetical protein